MASSNEFGMPVSNSPANQESAGTHDASSWMKTKPAHAAADELARGPPVALPVVGDVFGSLNDVRIHIMAHAIQNDWSASTRSGVRVKAGLQITQMACQYGGRKWKASITGECRFRVEAGERRSDGLVEILEVNDEHCTHEVGQAPPSSTSLKKPDSVRPSIRDARAYDEDGSSDESSSSSSDDDDNDGPVKETSSVKPSIKKNPLSVVSPSTIDSRARALIASGNAPSRLVGYSNADPMEIRVHSAAFALANGFVLQLNSHSANVHSFRCHKSAGRQRDGASRCMYSVHSRRSAAGEDWVVDEIKGEHNHPLNEKITMESLGGAGRSGRGNEGRAVSGTQKRAREEVEVVIGKSAYNPRIGAIKGSVAVAQQSLSSTPRRSNNANAVGSGSGSKGTVATQYSVGSSSQRRLPPSLSTSAIAPRPPNVIPSAPRPWPVELARLVTVMNKALLPKSHIFAAIFIKAGVVNRHEFSKLIWTFAAPTMQDQRMQWFIRRLRRERNGVAFLTHVEVVQFRSGVKRVYHEIIPKET